MKILVTGGAGFIGSHFVRTLLTGGYPPYADARRRRPRQADLRGQPREPRAGRGLAAADVRRGRHPATPSCVGDLMAGRRRGRPLRGRVARRPLDHRRGGLRGDERRRHADAAGGGAAARGSGGSCTSRPTRCTARSPRARGPRRTRSSRTRRTARARPAATCIARAYHRTHGLDVVITRCSNNYGPYQFPEKVIPLFVTNLIDGKKVPLYGEGANVRDWLHVDDHCRGIALVLAGGRPGEVYNIGGGTELTNRELTEQLLEACGADWVAGRARRRPQGPRPAVLGGHHEDPEELGYRPQVPFEEGLADTVAWYRATGTGGSRCRRGRRWREVAGHRRGRDARARRRSRRCDGRDGRPRCRRADLDVTDASAVAAAVAGHDVVVNAAAWTGGRRRRDARGRGAAGQRRRAAGAGPACADAGARLVHVSTDYVFDGDGHDAVRRGRAARAALGVRPDEGSPARRPCARSCRTRTGCVRTAWLYGEHGRNFVRTMARLERERETVDVVDDQRGQPTWTRDVAAQVAGARCDAGAAGRGYHATSTGATRPGSAWRGRFSPSVGADPERVRPTTTDQFLAAGAAAGVLGAGPRRLGRGGPAAAAAVGRVPVAGR